MLAGGTVPPVAAQLGFSWWDTATEAPANPTCSSQHLIFYSCHCQPGKLLMSLLFLASSCTLSTRHAGRGHACALRMTKMLPLAQSGEAKGFFFFFPKGFFQSHLQGCVSPLESHLHFYPQDCKCSWVQSKAQLQPQPLVHCTHSGRCQPPLFPRRGG